MHDTVSQYQVTCSRKRGRISYILREVHIQSHPRASDVRRDVVCLVAEHLAQFDRILQVPAHQLHQRRRPALPTVITIIDRNYRPPSPTAAAAAAAAATAAIAQRAKQNEPKKDIIPRP